jgi:transposase
MKASSYTRSSRVSLKFSNDGKLETIKNIVNEYNRLLNLFIQFYWSKGLDYLPKFCPSSDYKLFQSFLNAFLVQAAGKQALGIVRGTFQKQKQRLFVYERLLKENQIKKAKKLKRIIDETNVSIPVFKDVVPMQLSGVKINLSNKTSFDGWLSIPNHGHPIEVPFKKTKHFNKKLKDGGILKASCLLSTKEIQFVFEFVKALKTTGETIGIDIGVKNIITCSNGFQSAQDELFKVQQKLARKEKGSKAFARAQKERLNLINRTFNQFPLDGIKEVRREDIRDIRKFKRTSRLMQCWTYTEIFGKLDRYCEEHDVRVTKVSPTYTSQRCSVCGWTRKSNRKGKQFKCEKCGHTEDSDLNASKNIGLRLEPIRYSERQIGRTNETGFY